MAFAIPLGSVWRSAFRGRTVVSAERLSLCILNDPSAGVILFLRSYLQPAGRKVGEGQLHALSADGMVDPGHPFCNMGNASAFCISRCGSRVESGVAWAGGHLARPD
jgi:hypothetical protein